MEYAAPDTDKAFAGFLKQFYAPKHGAVERVVLPRMRFLSFRGSGRPDDDPFHEALQSLYAVAYTLKMGLKHGKLYRPPGGFDFKMPPLEALWQMDGPYSDAALDRARWRQLILMPAFVSEPLVEEARHQAGKKKSGLPIAGVTFEALEEGPAVQTLHMGPYAEETPTVALLERYAAQNGLAFSGPHHEIYLSDPDKTAPAKLKTILRYPVAAL